MRDDRASANKAMDPEGLIVTGVMISSVCALLYLGLYAPFGSSLWPHVLAAVPFLLAIPVAFAWADRSRKERKEQELGSNRQGELG